MSILIKGMEMPHDCDECKLCAFIPVGDYGINRKCMPLNAKAEISIRRTDCPLAPVPPHGDLIDRNELKENCMKEDSFLAELLFRKVSNAPTIIPAEEGARHEN